jgi:23S rRNA (uracil1939-C5)-methyltransferase
VGFEQVQPDFGNRIRSIALDMLESVADRLVWDLYAGGGEGTALLAARGARVESIERDPELFALAQRETLPTVRRFLGSVEEVVGQLSPPDSVVVNPPRTGLGATVTEALGSAGPECIAYVSCDPATLARDIRRLGPQYGVEAVRAFDLFPQTAHVESVVLLARR